MTRALVLAVLGTLAWPVAAHAGDLAADLRTMDQLHAIPDVPARAGSWGEWLYFNGQAGETRFYLTFLLGPKTGGERIAYVLFELEHEGVDTSYSVTETIDAASVPVDGRGFQIGNNVVDLSLTRYRMTVDLPVHTPDRAPVSSAPRLAGEITIDAEPGRAMPPVVFRGTGGWESGYVVPVMSGALSGELTLGEKSITLTGGRGYHDHNWGFWGGTTWRWGQIAHKDVSLVYWHVIPPPDTTVEGAPPLATLAAVGPGGSLGRASHVSIEEVDDPATGQPRNIVVRGRGPSLTMELTLSVENAIRTPLPQLFGADSTLVQMRTLCRARGVIAGRRVKIAAAPGSAETFRKR